MKIGLFTDTYYPEINGVANSVFLLKKELEERGNQVYVFTVSNPDVKEQEEHVYRMKSVACPLMRDRRMCCSFFQQWFPLIKSLNLDVIHTQTEFLIGHIGRKSAEKLHIPHVHTYHTLYEDYTHYLKIPGNKKLKGVVRSLSRICCDHADTVIVPTQKVKDLLFSYGVKSPVLVQPTGIELSKFCSIDWRAVKNIRVNYGMESDQHILISVGRLSEEKNIQEIIGNMPEIITVDPKVRLFIVGDGPERSKLEALVTAKKLDAYVMFAGEVDWDHIQNYYALGDVFVCASISETQGLTYIEALACGKPILVREDECVHDLLMEGVNGYCYRDATEFIQKYNLLFQQEKYQTMQLMAKASVTKMCVEMFGENMEKIYRTLIQKERAKGDKLHEQVHSVVGQI